MTAASILIPGKFVVLIGQLLITIVILHTRNDNIYAGLPANTNSNSDAFHSAESKLLGAVAMTIIFLVIELIILFIGISLFYDKNNLFQCLMHGLGTILYSWFVLDKWHYYSLWYLWAIFSLIPLFFEVLTLVMAILFYRKIK